MKQRQSMIWNVSDWLSLHQQYYVQSNRNAFCMSILFYLSKKRVSQEHGLDSIMFLPTCVTNLLRCSSGEKFKCEDTVPSDAKQCNVWMMSREAAQVNFTVGNILRTLPTDTLCPWLVYYYLNESAECFRPIQDLLQSTCYKHGLFLLCLSFLGSQGQMLWNGRLGLAHDTPDEYCLKGMYFWQKNVIKCL